MASAANHDHDWWSRIMIGIDCDYYSSVVDALEVILGPGRSAAARRELSYALKNASTRYW